MEGLVWDEWFCRGLASLLSGGGGDGGGGGGV